MNARHDQVTGEVDFPAGIDTSWVRHPDGGRGASSPRAASVGPVRQTRPSPHHRDRIVAPYLSSTVTSSPTPERSVNVPA
jgi:hypothetical protein